MKKIYLLTFLAGFFTHTHAQTETGFQLEDVIIEEGRISNSYKNYNRNVQILTSNEIKNLPVKSIAELLSFLGGVDIQQRGAWGAQADVSIDGGTFDQTLLLINGTKVSDAQTGHNLLNIPINLLDIERIEVIKGPASRSYGVNALTGAINIITKKENKELLQAHVYSGSNFNNDDSTKNIYGSIGAEVRGNYKTKTTEHHLSYGAQVGNGYRYNSGFAQHKALYEIRSHIKNDININAVVGYIYNDFGANGFYSAPGDVNATEQVTTLISSLQASFPITKSWLLKPRLSYRNNHDVYTFIKQKPEVYQNDHRSNNLNIELNNSINSKIGQLGFGVEYKREALKSSNLGERNRDNIGIYGEINTFKIPHFQINLGAYLNYNEQYGWRLFPGIDLGVPVTNLIHLYANMHMAQRLPTYTDLYYIGPTNIGNEHLMPEYSRQIEIGNKLQHKSLNFRVNYFYRVTDNFIDWVRVDSLAPWMPMNYHTINTHGISTQIYWQNELNKNNTRLRFFNIAYNYLLPSIRANESMQSIYALKSLKHQLIGNLNFQLLNNFSINISGKYQHRYNTQTRDVFKMNDLFIVDARATYTIKKTQIYADVNNILNYKYIETGLAPLPGRWFNAGFQFNVQ